MVKHIILWKIKEGEDKALRINGIKNALEGLNGRIDGLVSLKVRSEFLPSASADVMLDSEFTDEAALKGYSVNPLHTAAADTYVRPYAEIRLAADYEE